MRSKSDSLRRWIIVGIVGLVLAITFSWGYQIENYQELHFGWGMLGTIGLVWILSSLGLFFVFAFFDKVKIKQMTFLKGWPSWKIFFLIFAAMMLIYAIHFLALYPGLFIFDGPHQIEIYENGRITEHHPVLHTLITGFLILTVRNITGAFNHGVALYTIVQIGLSALCFSYVTAYVQKRLNNWIITGITFLYLSCYTPIVLQVLSITKDSYFFVALLMACTLTIELIEEPKAFAGNIPKMMGWVICVVLTAIFRNNCVYAIPFLVLGALVCVKESKKKVLIMVGAVLALGLLYSKVFVPAVTVRGIDQREMLSVPIQQMVRIYMTEDADVAEQERHTIEQLVTERGLEEYQPGISDGTKGNFDLDLYEANKAYYDKLYLDLVLRNPKICLESFLENTCGFWYPGCELTLFRSGEKGYWVLECYWPAETNSKIDFLYDYYKNFENSDFVTGNTLSALLFAPGTFFYLFAIMFAYAIDKRRNAYTVILLFVFVLWLTYLLGPVALVRYAIYLYVLIPLYFLQVLDK